MDSDEERAEFIETKARSALRPSVGLPLFGALFVSALAAKNLLGAEEAGMVIVLLAFVFPYYVMQLLMRWQLREHAERWGAHRPYVPTTSRTSAAIYLGCWFVSTWALMWLDGLIRR